MIANVYWLRCSAKCQNNIGEISQSEIDSNYLDIKLKVSKKDDNKNFR